MHAGNQNRSDEQSEDGENDSAGKAKTFGGGMLFAQHGKSSSNGTVNEHASDARKHCIGAKISVDGKDEQQDGKNQNGDVRRAKKRMNFAEEGREIATFGHGKRDARSMQHIGAEVAVCRDERACGDDLDADARKETASGIDDGSSGCTGIRHRVDYEILHGDIKKSCHGDGSEEREGNVFAGVAGFAGSNERSFKATVGVDHQEDGFKPVGGCGADCHGSDASFRMESEGGGSGKDEEREQADFGDGEKIAEAISAGDAAIVHDGEKADEKSEGDSARDGRGHAREKFTEIGDEKIGDGGNGGDAREPGQPTVLNGEEASESDARVKIRAAGVLKLRCDFRHAGSDDGDGDEGNDKADGAETAEVRSNERGQAEDARANHGVDHERGEAPAADGAYEPS